MEEIDWAEYDMTEWNSLEERFLSEEDIETLNNRRKEIETRKKQVYLEKVRVEPKRQTCYTRRKNGNLTSTSHHTHGVACS